jgi:hypothetical protein
LDIVGEYAEADLLRYYGVDLYDVLEGKVAPRRVLSLLRGLPGDSYTQQALRAHHEGAELTKYFGWGPAENILAGIYNNTAVMQYVAQQSNTKTKVPKPTPIEPPRPRAKPTRSGLASLRGRASRDAGDY